MASVIIPSYNHQQFIVEAIASVVQQDYRPLEILLIDDGSTDQTYELGLDHLRESDIPFLALKKKNQGSCVSGINLGIQRCNGAYVSLLSSDDIYLPGKLSVSIDALICQNADLALAKIVRMSADGAPIHHSETPIGRIEQSYRRGTLLQEMICPKSGFGLPYLSMVWRRSTFNIVGLYDPTVFTEDYDMSLRIAIAKLNIAFVHQSVAVYRLIAKSQDYYIRVAADSVAVLMKHKNHLGEGVRAALAYGKANRAIVLMRSKRPFKSVSLLLDALVQHPPVSLYLLHCFLYWLRGQSKTLENG